MERSPYAEKRISKRVYNRNLCTGCNEGSNADAFTGEKVEQVSVELPQGEKLQLDITDIQRKYTDRELPDMVSCAVKKNSGDDPDITNGVLVYSQVRLSETGQIHIDGGIGVGRVIRPGLNQPVGEAAINRVPSR